MFAVLHVLLNSSTLLTPVQFAMQVTEALATYNQPTHHKTFPFHGVTKPTPTSWYCEPLHYFADLDRLDS